MEDLELLEELAYDIRDASLCGLGQTAPNPVISTLVILEGSMWPISGIKSALPGCARRFSTIP